MTEASRDPLVSVIVCVFNGEKFLRETLDSALAQTHERLELVVVDDGSSDGSVALVESRADPRITLLRRKHGGAACALAAGLDQARGEYIAFLDQDDLWEPDKLATHVEWMRGRPGIDLTFSWFRYIDSSGQDIGRGSNRYRGTIDFRGLLTDFVIGATSNVVARRAAIGAAGGVDTEFPRVYDLDLFLRIARLAPGNTEAIPRYLMRYRRHDQQITRDPSALERRVGAGCRQDAANRPGGCGGGIGRSPDERKPFLRAPGIRATPLRAGAALRGPKIQKRSGKIRGRRTELAGRRGVSERAVAHAGAPPRTGADGGTKEIAADANPYAESLRNRAGFRRLPISGGVPGVNPSVGISGLRGNCHRRRLAGSGADCGDLPETRGPGLSVWRATRDRVRRGWRPAQWLARSPSGT